jgi:hypothetical protein
MQIKIVLENYLDAADDIFTHLLEHSSLRSQLKISRRLIRASGAHINEPKGIYRCNTLYVNGL